MFYPISFTTFLAWFVVLSVIYIYGLIVKLIKKIFGKPKKIFSKPKNLTDYYEDLL
jgi:hypothetical protein